MHQCSYRITATAAKTAWWGKAAARHRHDRLRIAARGRGKNAMEDAAGFCGRSARSEEDAIWVDLLRRTTKPTTSGGRFGSHGRQHGQHRRRNENGGRQKGCAALPAGCSESAEPHSRSGQEGLSKREIAKRLVVSRTSVIRLLPPKKHPERLNRQILTHGGVTPNTGAAGTVPLGEICRNLLVPEVDLPEKVREGAPPPSFVGY